MLAQAVEARAPIKMLGWTYIITAVLAGVTGVVPLLQPQGTSVGEGLREMLAEFPGAFQTIVKVLSYERPLAVGQLLVALAAAAAGIAFLGRRAWARLALEAVTWLSLSGALLLGAVWLACWLSLAQLYVMDEPGLPPAVHLLSGAVGLLLMLLWAAPHLVLLKLLRGRAVRGAMTGSRA